jgi:uncharacterized protein YjbJ (UPF0337 family)
MGERLDELKGNVKKGLGRAAGSPGLESEGAAEAGAARTRRKVGGLGDEVGGALKEAAGKATGSPGLEVEGKADRVKGRARRA